MSLTNKSKIREFAIDYAKASGRVQFHRVGKSFIDRVEARLAAVIRGEIQRHPSIGKTLK